MTRSVSIKAVVKMLSEAGIPFRLERNGNVTTLETLTTPLTPTPISGRDDSEWKRRIDEISRREVHPRG